MSFSLVWSALSAALLQVFFLFLRPSYQSLAGFIHSLGISSKSVCLVVCLGFHMFDPGVAGKCHLICITGVAENA